MARLKMARYALKNNSGACPALILPTVSSRRTLQYKLDASRELDVWVWRILNL